MAAKKQENDTRLNDDGQPFESYELANDYMRQHELPTDVWGVWQDAPNAFRIMKLQSIVAMMTEAQTAQSRRHTAVVPTAEAAGDNDGSKLNHPLWRECYMVTFAASSSDNDREFVPLSVEGYQIQIPRGVPVPLPLPLIESAKHASVERIDSLEGKEFDRSIRFTGQTYTRYPYSVGERVPYERWLEMLRVGTAEARRLAGMRTDDAVGGR